MRASPTRVRLRDGREVVLRSPEAEDARESLAFLRALSRESSRFLNHPPSFFDVLTEDAQAMYLGTMAIHPRNVMIAAWLDDAMIGNADTSSAGGSFATHVGEIGLGVLRDFHRLGLGRVLMESLIAAAGSAGVSNLILRVRSFNDAAIRLYEQLGFVRVGTLIGVARLEDGTLADEHVYQRERNTSERDDDARSGSFTTPSSDPRCASR